MTTAWLIILAFWAAPAVTFLAFLLAEWVNEQLFDEDVAFDEHAREAIAVANAEEIDLALWEAEVSS